jgi:hypothetical protein
MEFDWRTFVVLLALGAAALWVWRSSAVTPPRVPMVPNATPAPEPPPGVPSPVARSMAGAVDTQIPVIMTTGTPVPYDDAEVARLTKLALARLNAGLVTITGGSGGSGGSGGGTVGGSGSGSGDGVTLIAVVDVAKTQDSYKTVAYEIVASVYDPRHNVGMLLTVSLLVPVSGAVYVRRLQAFNKARDDSPLVSASVPAGHATFESPLALLARTRPGGPA